MNVYTYEELRSHVNDGDIVFVLGSWRRPFHAITMWATNSLFAHVFIVFWSYPNTTKIASENRLMVLEVQTGSKREIVPFDNYVGNYFCVIKAPKPWSSIKHLAMTKIGKSDYSIRRALYVGLRELFWNSLKIRLPKTNNTRVEICSEFIARVYDLPEHHLSPQKLWDLLIQTGAKEYKKEE